MPRLLLLSVMLFFHAGAFSQILDNNGADLFSSDPFFNTLFIKENHIKEIIGSVSIKNINKPIRKTGLVRVFQFDTLGRLVLQYETFKGSHSRLDTNVMHYRYEANGHLSDKIGNDHYGFYREHYVYDSRGNKISESYYRDENKSGSLLHFVSGNPMLIKTETMTHLMPVAGQHKILVRNNSGRAYKEIMIRSDAMGNDTLKEEIYMITRKGVRVHFSYDEHLHISKRIQKSDLGSHHSHSIFFRYDEQGNVVEEQRTKDGKDKSLVQFLYYPNMLLKARLVKDEATRKINITEYQYLFR